MDAVLHLCFVPINLPPSLNEACTNVAVHDHQMSLQLSTLNSWLFYVFFIIALN